VSLRLIISHLLAKNLCLLFYSTALFLPLWSHNEQDIPVSRALQQLPITVVITSFNNRNWYKENLDSVFKQQYTNYKILYFDDCSTDGTAHLVRQYTQQQKQTQKLTLIENKAWLSQMANHYYAVHKCDDQDIIIHLDGDDKLAHPHVLSFINSVYQDPNVWITFGRYNTFPSVYIPPKITQQELMQLARTNTFREQIYKSFPYIHLRTVRAWLFKCIKLQDLIHQSSFAFMSPAPDLAFMVPMLEMAGLHSRVLDQILYNYNLKNPLSQFTLNMQKIFDLAFNNIVKWPKYTPLVAPQNTISKRYLHSKADVIVLAHTASPTLIQNLKSLVQHVSNMHTITLLIPAQEKYSFDILKASLITTIYELKIRFYTHFKQELLDTLAHSVPHVVLSFTNNIITKTIDLNECIRELEKTYAYAFHLQLAYPGPQLDKLHAPITPTVIAWQRDYTQAVWNPDHTTGAILYRSSNIAQFIQTMQCNNLHEFKKIWHHRNHKLPARTVELSFR
jgi:glycosyltransferase involved in cell wall biosynthesis